MKKKYLLLLIPLALILISPKPAQTETDRRVSALLSQSSQVQFNQTLTSNTEKSSAQIQEDVSPSQFSTNTSQFSTNTSQVSTSKSSVSRVDTTPSELDTTPQKTDTLKVLPQYSKLYEVNSDLIGYIYLTDDYHYPIVQSIDNQNFYLDHNFFKEYEKSGSVFANAHCTLNNRGITLIYGHNMRNNSMFGTLDNYKKEDYFTNNKIIQIDSIYESSSYEVVGLVQTSLSADFKYYEYLGTLNEEDFSIWKEGCEAQLLKGTLKDLTFEDTIIELSTCAYHTDNGRLVLILKKL